MTAANSSMSSAEGLAVDVIATLRERGLTLATCESLTGGLIGATLTSVPGASVVYRGGLITYHSALKVQLAQVDANLVNAHGVVNADTARQMAVGAAAACGADLCIAVTGVAGPDITDGEPVGTVWMGLAVAGHSQAKKLELDGNRVEIRARTTCCALDWLLRVLSES